ncbi:MAG TPA: branched-chain amino acid ABC transporter permease [Candidatus Sumerlaeota bacterium]|nr:MAG: High-affinity branched-chain amino acid transport system permease protein LivH [candidate division BRC1 bacterium ADurb.Bin183]HOE62920.1 branched-chain amino acid ABC transporter permease [Candidatus Sumerlaeota bacterium]HRR31399.1 branched-chain amino acid ABC transporter permease [Candidatus Sumerlaeia bacterium]HON50269.1 branched-chain amino acid ABC transporter permease [Candidatus Sumerlaeota bacterium]HOR63486.1 branched-chain amino acid ABC transporter permease [Candidatus Sum
MNERFFQNLISGVSMGSIYALAALGFNIIYNATGIVNLAQGEFVMLGGMFMVLFGGTLGVPLGFAIIASVFVVTLIGIIFERTCINTLKNPTVMVLVMITVAASIILKGVTMFLAGKEIHTMEYFSGGHGTVPLWGGKIPTQTFWVLGTLAVVVSALVIFFNFTLAGKAMRACAFDRTAARLMGIPARRMVLLSFGLSSAISALAGAVIMPISMVDYQSGAMFGIKGFGAAILGGLGHNPGAVAAGLILGILESLSAGYISSHYKDALPLLILLIVLFIKPSGLFGSEAAGRLKKF